MENRKKDNKKNKIVSCIMKLILLVILVVIVTCVVYLGIKFSKFIKGEIEGVETPGIDEYTTATPRPDMKIINLDGTKFDGHVFFEEMYSDDDSKDPNAGLNYVKSIANGKKFCLVYVSTDKNENTTQSFDNDVWLYLVPPVGMHGDKCNVYMMEQSENGAFIISKMDIHSDGTFMVIKTNKIAPFVVSEDDINIEEQPTPTPPYTDDPITPTPTIDPITPIPPPTNDPSVTPDPPINTPNVTEPPVIDLAETMNIVLYGVDSRNNEFTGQSDTIMILSINTKSNTMTLTSIMRDLWVEIYNNKGEATGKYAKINAAFSWYGSKGSMATIEHYFGIKLDAFAVVNFAGIADIMTVLGGVELELTDKEAEIVFWPGVKGGKHWLSGAQALTYMRIRYIDNDRNRTLRQGKVLQALLERFSTSSFTDLLGLFEQCTKYVRTNMDILTMQNVARVVYNARANGLNHSSYPVKFKDKTQGTGGQWAVEENNKEYNMEWFRKRIYGYTE